MKSWENSGPSDIPIRRPMGVVHPSGDSVLMADIALELPPGRALDLGCGTGYLGIRLAKAGWEVDAVDISPRALKASRESAELSEVQLRVFHSDWFGSVEDRYDLILCNPPMWKGESDRTRLLTAALRWFPSLAFRLHRLSQPIFERIRRKGLAELVLESRKHLEPNGQLMMVISPGETRWLLQNVPGLRLQRSQRPENCAPNLDVVVFSFE